MFAFKKSLSSKVKDLAILSDKSNVKILCTLEFLSEKTGKEELMDDEIVGAGSISKRELTTFGNILNKTKCIQKISRNEPGGSPHDFYKITPYGKNLLKMVGIDRRIIRNEIEKNSTSHD